MFIFGKWFTIRSSYIIASSYSIPRTSLCAPTNDLEECILLASYPPEGAAAAFVAQSLAISLTHCWIKLTRPRKAYQAPHSFLELLNSAASPVSLITSYAHHQEWPLAVWIRLALNLGKNRVRFTRVARTRRNIENGIKQH